MLRLRRYLIGLTGLLLEVFFVGYCLCMVTLNLKHLYDYCPITSFINYSSPKMNRSMALKVTDEFLMLFTLSQGDSKKK